MSIIMFISHEAFGAKKLQKHNTSNVQDQSPIVHFQVQCPLSFQGECEVDFSTESRDTSKTQ